MSNPPRSSHVHFNKVVRKRPISPLHDKPLHGVRLPEDCVQGESCSFVQLTDPSYSITFQKPLNSPQIFDFATVKDFVCKENIENERISVNCVEDGAKRMLDCGAEQVRHKAKARRSGLGSAAGTSLWVEAFKPKREVDLLAVDDRAFVEWLQNWSKKLDSKRKIEAEPPKKKRRSKRLEDADDDYILGADVEDLSTMFIIGGPTGCGKTNLVYLRAKKAGFNVIEISASELRNAVTLRKNLSGAMENFAVRTSQDLRSFFGARPTQQRIGGGTTKNLILMDDADVVFACDTGFWSQIAKYCIDSKVPIVLTCTNIRTIFANIENSDFEYMVFRRRNCCDIIFRLQHWFSSFTGKELNYEFVKAMVGDAVNQDVRGIVNQMQFYAGMEAIECESVEPSVDQILPPHLLAEFDAILGTYDRLKEKRDDAHWCALVTSNLDFVPGASFGGEQKFLPVDDREYAIEAHVREEVTKRRDPGFQRIEHVAKIEAESLLNERFVRAPVNMAVYDTFRRCHIPKRPRVVALDEMAFFATCHRAFVGRTASTRSRSRIQHPFNTVDNLLGYALDIRGKLAGTIADYTRWLPRKPGHEGAADDVVLLNDPEVFTCE